MQIELSYLLGPLMGGIIGYITNYLAIRMMFRPHQPKHIFGKRIPFTPGIIPKERFRIAEAVGDSISENLMNKEVLAKNLLSEEMLGKIGCASSWRIICLHPTSMPFRLTRAQSWHCSCTHACPIRNWVA